MQAVLVDLDGVEAGLRSKPARAVLAPAAIGELVLPSRSLTAVERVAVYQEMYFLRMRDALLGDYPGLHHFLGKEGFDSLIRGYIQKYPSRSYTLNRLGDHLPRYIRAAKDLPRHAFLHDLARLELAVTEVFDAVSSAPLTAERVEAVPPEAWVKARLVPVEAFRLLALDYPVSAYLSAVRDATPPPSTRKKPCWVAVYRNEFAVRRLDLSEPAHDLLSRIARGRPLGEALARTLSRYGRRLGEAELFTWFRGWVASGMFRAIE